MSAATEVNDPAYTGEDRMADRNFQNLQATGELDSTGSIQSYRENDSYLPSNSKPL